MDDLEQPDVQTIPAPGAIPDGQRLYDIHATVAVMQHQLKAVGGLEKRMSALETFRTRVISTVAVGTAVLGLVGGFILEAFHR